MSGREAGRAPEDGPGDGERYRALLEHARDIIAVCDADGGLTYVTPSVAHVLGRPAGELVGKTILDYIGAGRVGGDTDAVVKAFRDIARKPGATCRTTIRTRHADGSWRHIDTSITNLLDDEVVRGIVINARDITSRWVSDTLLAGQAHVLSLVTDQVPFVEVLDALVAIAEEVLDDGPCAFLLTDADDSVLTWGTGPSWPVELRDLVAPVRIDADAPTQAPTPARAVASGELAVTEDIETDAAWSAGRDAARDRGYASCWAVPVTLPSGRAAGACALLSPKGGPPKADQVAVVQRLCDLAAIALARAQAREELTRQALHDHLTDLPNRTLFLDRLAHALAGLARSRSSLAVLFLDLDRFKLVNDSLGHHAGDQLLVAVADRLRATLRPGDTAARLGGDEFTLLCEGLSGPADAAAIADRVAGAIRLPFHVGDTELVVSTSVGIALASDPDQNPEALLRDADAAMYRAKERGKARFELFDEEMRRRSVERLDTENALRRALERDEFELAYQPDIDLRTGRITGVEALIRWHHPKRGVILPTSFIGLAEETGLIVPIGEWVLEEACRRAASWWHLVENADDEDGTWGPRLTMRVNISARQLSHAGLPGMVARALDRTGVTPAAICLEITESALMEDAESATRTLDELRALGVRIAIDDFGTGYSSLAYLKRFPVDALKVDQSFISGLGEDPEDSAIVQAVINLAHSLGLDAVAEGVETDAQVTVLRELGCDGAQGFHFSPAREPRVVEKLLKSTQRY